MLKKRPPPLKIWIIWNDLLVSCQRNMQLTTTTQHYKCRNNLLNHSLSHFWVSVLFFITVIDYILSSAIRKFSSVGQRMQQAFSFAYTSSPFVHPALKQFSLKGINSLEALSSRFEVSASATAAFPVASIYGHPWNSPWRSNLLRKRILEEKYFGGFATEDTENVMRKSFLLWWCITSSLP